jgi:hypothetical protein
MKNIILNFQARSSVALLILILFILFGYFFNKASHDKWFLKYSIETDIQFAPTAQALERILNQLELKGPNSPTLENFLSDEIKETDISFITKEYPNISKPNLESNSIVFYTNDLTNINQITSDIVNNIEGDLKPRIIKWIQTYKNIAQKKLLVKKNSDIKKKVNELDFYKSRNFIDRMNIQKERELKEYTTKFDNLDNITRDMIFMIANNSSDPKNLLQFDIEMLNKNNPINYEFIETLEFLEEDMKNLKVISAGRLMAKFDKKPSMLNNFITFAILGAFSSILFILLTSKFSKKLKTKMSLFLQDLR